VRLHLPLDPIDYIVHGPLFRGRSGKIYVPAGGAYRLTAKVTNTANTDVEWRVEGGEANGHVSPDGLYEAPDRLETPRVVQVHARSAADPTKQATAVLNIPPVLVQAKRDHVTARMGATVALEADVENSEDPRIQWSVEGGDRYGTVSPAGVYRAPEELTTPTTVQVRATSQVDPTKFARVAVALQAVSVELRPDRAEVSAGQEVQLRARVSGSDNPGVFWTLEPRLGSLSDTGVYRAPRTVSHPTIVRITSVSASDRTKRATAEIHVKPGR
jgi:hypothetical protein